MKTILFFCHNFGWLWHLSRTFNIAWQLAWNFWEEYRVIVLNSWEKQDIIQRNEKIKVLDIPKYDIKNFILEKSPQNEKIFQLRRALYIKIFKKYEVDTIVVEHFPFWRNFLTDDIWEFIHNFRLLYSWGKVFCSVRDIFDVEILDRKNLSLFDRVLIHGEREVKDYDFFFTEEEQKKIFYTWYVASAVSTKKDQNLVQKNHIVVSIWWWNDGFSFIEDFLLLCNKISFSWKIYISLWKSFSEENKNKLEELSIHRLIIQDFFDNFFLLKQTSCLIVSMWWYNNVVENLFLWKKSIIYPRKNDYEQKERLEKLGWFTNILLDGNHMTSEILEGMIAQNDTGVSENIDLDFLWGYKSASFIALFGRHKYIKIRLLNSCNAECDMCWVIRRPLKKNNFETLKQAIHDFYLIGGEIVNFTGGEPTIHNSFYDLLKIVKDCRLSTSVSTNGATLRRSFYSKIISWKKLLIDYIDISVDFIWKRHDIVRWIPWLFEIVRKNIPVLKKLWVKIHINVTIRKDNIYSMEQIYDSFAFLKVDSISFSMIDTWPFHDTVFLYPSYEQLYIFYTKTVPILEQKQWIKKLSISPKIDNHTVSSLILGILNKHNYEKNIWEKCPFISSMKEIRINENGDISPCCEIDDYDENIGNINNTQLAHIINSKAYYKFIHTRFPNISKACSSCKIVT